MGGLHLHLLLLLAWQGTSFFGHHSRRHPPFRPPPPPHAVPLVDYAQKLCVPSSLFGRPPAAGGMNATTSDDAPLLPALLHESDVNRLSVLLCDCLGSGEVFLPEDGGDFTKAEQVLLRAMLGAWNAFARSASRYETALGIRVRCKDRLKFDEARRRGGHPRRDAPRNEEGEGAAGGGEPAMMAMTVGGADGLLDGAYEPDFGLRGRRSLVLVMEDDAGEFVASAELALQPRDGQLPTNFPSLFGGGDDDTDDDNGDERRGAAGRAVFAAKKGGDLDAVVEEEEEEEEGMNADGQPALYYPYICNVAVAPEWRRRGLALHLVRLCEQLAARQWGFREVYLHVDPANEAATRLYRRTGYEPVPPEKRGAAARLFGGLLELMEPDVTYMYKKVY